MRIEHDIKLDYQDVLFKPKRSTLTSRKDVDLKRTFKFYNSKKEWTGMETFSKETSVLEVCQKHPIEGRPFQSLGP